MHLRGEQLIAYLDGEADETVKQHVEACDFCATRLEPFAALQRDLLRLFYRLPCQESQALSDYHLGLLAEAKASTVKGHLAECPYCVNELEALKQFLAEPDTKTVSITKHNHEKMVRNWIEFSKRRFLSPKKDYWLSFL